MQQLSVPYAYDFGKTMARLRHIGTGVRLNAIWPILYRAEKQMLEFYNQSAYREILLSSRAVGDRLLNAIKRLSADENQERVTDQYDVGALQSALDQFDTAFESEMNIAPIYLVTQKGGCIIRELIHEGWRFFPMDLTIRVPAAVDDIQEATRCLAYELPTAAAFHLHRINEAVLRKYWEAITSGAATPNNGTMGDYLAEMKKKNVGDPKVIAALRDLKDLHRNPIAHPEDKLKDVDEALGLLGAIRATIVHMLKEIPEPEYSNDELAEILSSTVEELKTKEGAKT